MTQNCQLFRHVNKRRHFFPICNVKFILFRLIKNYIFHILAVSVVCVLTEVSVGDNVPVVLAAVTLNLHPVTLISSCLIELHRVSGVTSWVDYLLITLTCEIIMSQGTREGIAYTRFNAVKAAVGRNGADN